MKNLTITSAVRNIDLSLLPTVDSKNCISRFVYEIDEVVIKGEVLEVDFLINEEWSHCPILIANLKSFVKETGMNKWSLDTSDFTGSHTQYTGSFDIDTFIEENLNMVVKSYLETYKIGR